MNKERRGRSKRNQHSGRICSKADGLDMLAQTQGRESAVGMVKMIHGLALQAMQ